jgi:hypothetical protein
MLKKLVVQLFLLLLLAFGSQQTIWAFPSGDGGFDPPLPQATMPKLSLVSKGESWISLKASCGLGVNVLYKKTGAATYAKFKTVTACPSTLTDTAVQPGISYTYRLETTTFDGQKLSSPTLSVTTLYRRVSFVNSMITPAESARVLQEFDWHQTDPIPEGLATQPALYYMNILMTEAIAVRALQMLGVHVQASAVFPEELSGWHDDTTLVTHDGHVTGRWYFAVVPGTIYNAIRAESLKALAAGQEPAFPVIVFRHVPTPQAREVVGDNHRLSYQYLGEQGFEYDAWPNCQVVDGVRVCQMQQELFGWLARKGFEWVAERFEDVVEGVREFIGAVTRHVKGDVTLTLTFALINTDAFFGAHQDQPMQSVWSGQPLYLKGMRVRVRQSLASFSGTTDDFGTVILKVAKNVETKICVEAENAYVKVTEFLTETLVCVQDLGKLSGDRMAPIPVKHPYFNVLAQMTDAAEYLHKVAEYDMRKITVLVGSWANRLAADDRAFAPCMGRLPNLLIGGGADLLLSALYPPAVLASAVTEFLYAVDIVLPQADETSRGVGVHEYGHAVMCDMMARQSVADFEAAWTDVILATTHQTADNDTSYIAEAFADFLAFQVVGGTNYFTLRGSEPHPKSDDFEGIHYCDATQSECLEENFTEKPPDFDDEQSEARRLFSAQVRRVASILYDAFDGPTDTGDDEPIALDGPSLSEIFARWSERANTVSEASFLGGLAQVLVDHRYTDSAICQLFAAHAAAGTCPDYVPSGEPAPNPTGAISGPASIEAGVEATQVTGQFKVTTTALRSPLSMQWSAVTHRRRRPGTLAPWVWASRLYRP